MYAIRSYYVCKGNQMSKPIHDSFAPLTEVVKCDLAIPGCPPSPEAIVAVVFVITSYSIHYTKLYEKVLSPGNNL